MTSGSLNRLCRKALAALALSGSTARARSVDSERAGRGQHLCGRLQPALLGRRCAAPAMRFAPHCAAVWCWSSAGERSV